jgi:hypothetical protein
LSTTKVRIFVAQDYESPSITDLGAFAELTQGFQGKPNEQAIPATGS